jgi:hypothetical protein
LVGLLVEHRQPLQVPGDDLQGRDDRGEPHRHGEGLARVLRRLALQELPGRDPGHHEAGGQIGRQDHVDQAVREGRVEDDLEPVDRHEAIALDGEPDRRLHPAVGGDDPEGGQQGAERHHRGGQEVELGAHPGPAEQHDPEEGRLHEEGGDHLVLHQHADHRTGDVGEAAPVGAELVAHDDAGHDAEPEGDGEQLHPEAEQLDVDVALGAQPQRLEHPEIAGQPDGEGREEDVEGDHKGELNARQQQRVEFHGPVPRLAWR